MYDPSWNGNQFRRHTIIAEVISSKTTHPIKKHILKLFSFPPLRRNKIIKTYFGLCDNPKGCLQAAHSKF